MIIEKIIKEREIRLKILNFLRFIPDEIMLKIEYKMKIGKKLNLKTPITFNEKIQWLKLNDRNPLYTKMADKYAVREYIKEKIGEKYLVPLYGIWNNVDEIPFNNLPKEFVLKCTHDSGSVILCQDKNNLDINKAKKKLKDRLKKNSFWYGREWVYKDIKPKIIAEKYLKDEKNTYLPVYKFFCFNGEPKIIQSIQNDKQNNETIDYFDIRWNLLNIKQRFPNSEKPFQKPQELNEMLEIAKKLSKDLIFLRVDLYIVNKRIYFSENTFYPDAGYSVFEPEEWDKKLGNWINLINKY